MTETLSEMLARHQQELAALVGQMTEEAHKDGMRAWYQQRTVAPSQKELGGIVEAVAAEAGTTAALILSHQHLRDKVLIHARRKCWALARKAKFSQEDIGKFFNRNHTTIAHGIKQFEQKTRKAA